MRPSPFFHEEENFDAHSFLGGGGTCISLPPEGRERGEGGEGERGERREERGEGGRGGRGGRKGREGREEREGGEGGEGGEGRERREGREGRGGRGGRTYLNTCTHLEVISEIVDSLGIQKLRRKRRVC